MSPLILVNLGCFLIFVGCWLFSDGVYSWTLYHHAMSYENGRKQTFWKDHWVRLIRIILSLILMVGGWWAVVTIALS